MKIAQPMPHCLEVSTGDAASSDELAGGWVVMSMHILYIDSHDMSNNSARSSLVSAAANNIFKHVRFAPPCSTYIVALYPKTRPGCALVHTCGCCVARVVV